MNYFTYEMAHALLHPVRLMTRAVKAQVDTPLNPLALTEFGRSISAACEVFEGVTRRYGKPEFGIRETIIDDRAVPVYEETVLRKTFCNLLHFKRDDRAAGARRDPKVLIIAPMSGHYATLLRGTVQEMVKEHEVYVTDWTDARDIPLYEGSFGFDDFVDYLIEFVRFLGPDTHLMAVCQPAVPALVAAAVMASDNDPLQPASMTLMGGPIDTRCSPTKVNELAKEKPLSWFEHNVIHYVPPPNPGFGRRVYPGFIQLTGFMTMNLERHTEAHMKLFQNLVKGDCESVKAHKAFYEEYLAVMDLPAEFYLETVKTVFQDHALPKGELTHHGRRVDCSAITRTALMTVEGERDDICGLGQTQAAHALCPNIPRDERYAYVQPGVGHYGIFSGSRWRGEIQPRIRDMIRTVELKRRQGERAENLPSRARLRAEPEPIAAWHDLDGAASGDSVN